MRMLSFLGKQILGRTIFQEEISLVFFERKTFKGEAYFRGNYFRSKKRCREKMMLSLMPSLDDFARHVSGFLTFLTIPSLSLFLSHSYTPWFDFQLFWV